MDHASEKPNPDLSQDSHQESKRDSHKDAHKGRAGHPRGPVAAPSDAHPHAANRPPTEVPEWAVEWAKHNVVDRRHGLGRGHSAVAPKAEPHGASGAGPRPDLSEGPGVGQGDAHGLGSFDRRRGAGHRLSDFNRNAEEGNFSTEQFMFVMAIDSFKRANAKTFPTWTDVLEVIRLLGYRKTCPSELDLRNAEDWHERPDAPSNVRPPGWDKRAA